MKRLLLTSMIISVMNCNTNLKHETNVKVLLKSEVEKVKAPVVQYFLFSKDSTAIAQSLIWNSQS